MALRTILFDLGNVLINFSHEKMYAQIAAVCDKTPELLRKHLESNGSMIDYEEGRLSDESFHSALEQWARCSIDASKLRHATADIFWLNSPMDEIVAALCERGLRLVLLSNTNPVHIAHVRQKWSVLEHFHELVLSCEVGAMKPRPEIFQAALRAIQCEPHECLYTDDIPEFVGVARGFGLHAEVFVGPDRFLEHLRRHGIDLKPHHAMHT